MSTDPGMTIEVFALAMKRRVFGEHIDRHHPELGWANADVVRRAENLSETKSRLNESMRSLLLILEKEEFSSDVLEKLGDLTDELKEASSPAKLASIINNSRDTTDGLLGI